MLSLVVPPVVLTFYTAWMTIGKFDILNTDVVVSQNWFFNYNSTAQEAIILAKVPDQT